MKVVHLTASTFLGGPERQMLGLARALAPEHKTALLSFSEGGRCRPFLTAAHRRGVEALALNADTPRFGSAIREVADFLGRWDADLLFCHGYKANLLGRPAARRAGVPAVGVSRGWTAECLKVRLYEWLDRRHLRWMDRVVCVSEAQAAKVRRAKVPERKVKVIANAVDPERFADPDPRCREKLLRYFREPPELIVGAAGRVSPEKGFDLFVRAAVELAETHPHAGFILFGEGVCRPYLLEMVRDAGLAGRVALPGFRADLDRFLPHLDVFVLPSYTEGLPNVVLEACAAGVPVVATAVGGTPEVIEHDRTGYLVPSGDVEVLAERIGDLLDSEDDRQEMAFQAKQAVLERFSFTAQARQYRALFEELCPGASVAVPEIAVEKCHEEAEPATEASCES
jgi:glycosyltransferase involved in cell wall biosynthesis